MNSKQQELNLTYPPPVIFWENVPGVLRTKDNAFGCFLAALCGSDIPVTVSDGKWPGAGIVTGQKRRVAWRTLNAQFFGVPQQRKRVFVVASSSDRFDPAKVLFERQSVCGDPCQSTEKRKSIASFTESSFGTFCETDDTAGTVRASGGSIGGGAETLIIDISHRSDVVREYDETAPTLTARMGTGGNNVPCIMDQGGNCINVLQDRTGTLRAQTHGHEPLVSTDARVRRLTPVECERLQGFPDDWTKIRHRGKPEESCPDSPRYKAIGNSWAVPVVRWIGERINNELNNR